MDLKEPINIQEVLDWYDQSRGENIGLQVRLLSIMMHNIKQIYRLSDQLSYELRKYPNYDSYDCYMEDMILIFKDLLKAEKMLKDAFPDFYHGRLVKLIRAQMAFKDK